MCAVRVRTQTPVSSVLVPPQFTIIGKNNISNCRLVLGSDCLLLPLHRKHSKIQGVQSTI